MDAIQLLKDDHKKVRALLAELAATTKRAEKKRGELLEKIGLEIEVHTSIEEEIFYPAFKEAGEKSDDDKLYFEALEEHRAAGDLVLPDLKATPLGSDQFGGRAKVLKELIEHHAGEEEKEMFPRAKKLLGAADLKALGQRMAERKRELIAGGKAPAKSAAKGVVGMGARLLDMIGTDPGPIVDGGRQSADGQEGRAGSNGSGASESGGKSVSKGAASKKSAAKKAAGASSGNARNGSRD